MQTASSAAPASLRIHRCMDTSFITNLQGMLTGNRCGTGSTCILRGDRARLDCGMVSRDGGKKVGPNRRRNIARTSVACACCVLLASTASALAVPADNYPARPVRLIVPFGPAASTDIIARLIAAKLGENLGQTVVVDNRAGAGGLLGT